MTPSVKCTVEQRVKLYEMYVAYRLVLNHSTCSSNLPSEL